MKQDMKTQNTNMVDWELLAAYLSENISDARKTEVEEWLSTSDENKALFTQAEKVWAKANTIHETVDTESAWQKVSTKANIINKPKTIWLSPKYVNYAMRVAAVLVIALGVWFVWPSANKTMVAKADEKSTLQVKLPDGSVVDLNRGAELQYPSNFNGSTREVTLKGEAFFNVHKNKQKPFIIKAGNSFIKALGTSFNVNCRIEDKVEVIVNSGVVAFYTIVKKSSEIKPIILLKGDKGILSPTGSLTKCKNNDDNFISWKTGKFIFRETELKDVFTKLEAYYNIDFQVNDSIINHCRLTATFDNKAAIDIIDVLKLTFDINVLQNNQHYIISGKGCENKLQK
jgi:transmembrane sensor